MASDVVGTATIKLAFDGKSLDASTKEVDSSLSAWTVAAGNMITKAFDKTISAVGNMIQTGINFDSMMSKVSAVSGAVGDELQQLRDKAKEMGATTKFSASEAAEAFNYMAMAGWKTEDMLSGIDGIMNLAAASGADLGTTSDIVTDALTGMGYAAKDAGRLADVMAAASSNANTNVEMMGETFKYVTPIAGAMGFNMEDTAIAIGLMANSGIKASQAGTSLRSIFQRLATDTNGCTAEFEALGGRVTNADGSMRPLKDIMIDLRKVFKGLNQEEQIALAKSIAGQNAMSGLLAIVNASDDDFRQLTDAVYGSNGAADEMAKTMEDNLGGSLTILKSAFEGLQINLMEKFAPVLRDIVEGATQFVNFLSENQGLVIGVIAGITAGMIAYNVQLLIAKGLDPFWWVPFAIAAVGALVGFIIGHFGEIVEFLGQVFGNVGAFIGNIVEQVGAFFSFIGENLGAFFGEVGRVVGEIWTNITAFIGGIATAIGEFFETVKQVVGEIWTNITTFIGNVASAIGEFFSNIGKFFATIAGWVYDNVLKPIFDFVKGIFEGIWNTIKGILIAIAALLAIAGEWVYNNVLKPVFDFFTEVFTNIHDFFVEVFTKVGEFFSAVFAKIGEVAESIGTAISTIFENVGTFLNEVFTNVGEFFGAVFGKIGEIASAIGSTIQNIFQNVGAFLNNVFTNIGNFFGAVFGKIGEIASNIGNTIRNVFEGVKNFINGVIEGIKGFFEGLGKAITQIFEGIKQTISNIFTAIANIVKAPINGIISGINGVIDGINSIKVPDWVPVIGGASPNLGKIPLLAEGGLADSTTLAIFGEAGTEAVLPLEQNTDNWSGLLADTLLDAMEEREATPAKDITIVNNVTVSNDYDAQRLSDMMVRQIRRAA